MTTVILVTALIMAKRASLSRADNKAKRYSNTPVSGSYLCRDSSCCVTIFVATALVMAKGLV